MPLFKCSKCGAIDNTALGDYWSRSKEPLCSECSEGKWHGEFPKIQASDGFVRGNDGFYYRPEELAPGGYFYGKVREEHPRG